MKDETYETIRDWGVAIGMALLFAGIGVLLLYIVILHLVFPWWFAP